MLSAMFMLFCVCSGGGGGVDLPTCGGWGGGGLLMCLVFLWVTSLSGVTSFISFWGFRVPGELCPGAPYVTLCNVM